MSQADIQEIKDHLSLAPRTASELAESAELPVETVYQCLVHLYDRGEAKIDKDRTGIVHGWTQGICA